MKCKKCGSTHIQKYGKIKVKRNGKVAWRQRYRCYDCLTTRWGNE